MKMFLPRYPATMPHAVSRLLLRSALLLAVGLAGGPAAASPCQLGPSGSYLLRKADALEAAGQLEAAATACNQATAAFRRSQDADGQQQALQKLAALEEKRADQLLASLDATPRSSAPPAGRVVPRPAPGPVAAPARRSGANAVALPGPAAAPLAGKVVSGRPQGLFFMSRYIIAFHSLEKATFYFTPTGQVYHNPVDFSATSLGQLPASDRGSFSLGAGQLVVKWADGQVSKAKLENPSSNAFTWDMGIFVGMGPFASARQLVGTFEGGNSVSSSSGTAAAVSGLTFRADGSYMGSSVSSFSTNTAGSNAHVGGSGAEAGRWALAGWTLTLTDGTGHTVRGVAYPIETDEKTGLVRRFYFNNVAYKRL